MIAELDDNHAQYGGGIFELFGRYRVPLNTGFVEGRLIVVTPDTVPVKSERKAPFQVGTKSSLSKINRSNITWHKPGNSFPAPTGTTCWQLRPIKFCALKRIGRYRSATAVTGDEDTLADVTKMPGHFSWNYLWKYHRTFSMLEDSIGYICPDKLSKEEIPEISNGLKKPEG